MLPITRSEAKKLGVKHYDTKKPCGRGHLAPRFTSIGKCMACAREDTMSNHIHTTTKRRAYNDLNGFINAAKEKHGIYNYDEALYINAHTPLKVICKIHGVFNISPTNHMQGKGCAKCMSTLMGKKQTKSTKLFIEQATVLWKDIFDYSKTNYQGAKTLIELRCKKHPEEVLKQQPSNHLEGLNPCTKCNHMKSAPEQAIAKYLSIFTPILQRDRSLISPKELDLYIPTANLAIEFHGMYWHSHFEAKTEDKNKHKTYDKYKSCAEKDVRLITIYETEWQNRQPQIKRLLRNAIGKTKGKLMARKCQVSMVPHTEAKEFFEKYHPQGGDGSGTHYGIYWKKKLVACMRFSLGSNDRGNTKTRDWTLSRYATRVNILGGASKLFKAFVKEQDPDLIKSFSDNRYFSGGMYEQLGFELVSESMPDYQVWSQKKGLFPKSHYQRRNVQKRLFEHGKDETYDHETDPRTEREMTYFMGAGRIYDCGKKKWVWTK